MQPNVSLNAPIGSTRPRPSGSGAQERKGFFSRGPIGAIVLALHLVLIYALAVTLGVVDKPGIVPPMQAVVIDMPQTQESEPVPVVKPDLEQPTLETPPLENTIPEIEVPVEEPAPAAIMAETSPAPPVPETANMQVNRRVDPVYPPASRRAGEEGSGLFRVLVDERGRPIQVEVLKSSGFPRLDEAAIAAIRKWTFKPAVQDSQPVRSWTRVQVSFELKNA